MKVAGEQLVLQIESEAVRSVEASLVLPVVPAHAGMAPGAGVAGHDVGVGLFPAKPTANATSNSSDAANAHRTRTEHTIRAVQVIWTS